MGDGLMREATHHRPVFLERLFRPSGCLQALSQLEPALHGGWVGGDGALEGSHGIFKAADASQRRAGGQETVPVVRHLFQDLLPGGLGALALASAI